MPPRVHPCFCGFTCDLYTKLKRHRARCAVWRDRPDPRGTMLARLQQAQKEPRVNTPVVCPSCRRMTDQHESWCVLDHTGAARREAVARYGIDPLVFETLLKVLARRRQEPPVP